MNLSMNFLGMKSFQKDLDLDLGMNFWQGNAYFVHSKILRILGVKYVTN